MTEGNEKRQAKLSKEIEGNLVKITVKGGTRGEMVFDFTQLPAEIQAKLGPFGLGHKEGDAAAGKEGVEAEEAIMKVWEGLKSGDWSVRAPAGPRVSVKALTDKLDALPEEAKAQAIAAFKNLGISIPGITD